MSNELGPLPGGAASDVYPTIDLMGPSPEPQVSGSEPNGCVDADGSAWRVLLVDDRSERRSVLRIVLGTVPPAGWTSVEVTEASDPSGAAIAANRHGLDAAVIEVQMAGGVGLGIIEALRAAHPDLVIVVCSFRSERDLQARSLRAGADAYLTKPVSRRELLSACRGPHRLLEPSVLDPAS
jgi:DNA-binding NarL/FixJ family response regulator